MFRKSSLLAAAALVAIACQRTDSRSADELTDGNDTLVTGSYSDHDMETPMAVVRDANNRELGELAITETANGLRVQGTLVGLPPGERAIHIHTTGVCEAPFTSAGPHWNPTNRQHGSDNPEGAHHGDMMNIVVGADSTVTIDEMTPAGAFHGDGGLLDEDGAAIVIHAAKDDYKSDPAGNAGDRIACGVIISR